MTKNNFFLLFLCLLVLSCSTYPTKRRINSLYQDYEDFVFGYELTFVKEDILHYKSRQYSTYMMKLRKGVKEVQKNYMEKFKEERFISIVPNEDNSFQIQFSKNALPISRDLNFSFFVDDQTYEITFNKISIKNLRLLEKTINQYFFNFLNSIGLSPHKYDGGGHVNIDIFKNFKKNYAYFRNFVVDMLNQSFLGMGIFRQMVPSVYPLHIIYLSGAETLYESYFDHFNILATKIVKLDKEYLKQVSIIKRKNQDVEKKLKNNELFFLNEIISELSTILGAPSLPLTLKVHNKDLEKKHSPRIEWRVPPPQKNVNGMLYFSEFLAKRITYIMKKYDQDNTLIKLQGNHPNELTDEESLKKFKAYILEMEENPDWNRHIPYLNLSMDTKDIIQFLEQKDQVLTSD